MSGATAKIPFRTAYSGAERHTVPSGNGKENVYEYCLNNKGQKQLMLVGEKNLYEEIQSHHEECKIENILRQVGVGDYSSFKPDGMYADISQVPNNLNEARKEIIKLENTWKKLPLETRAKYDNSVETFISQAGSEAWMIDMGLMQPKVSPEETPITKEPETTVPVPEETSKSQSGD